MPGKNFLVIHSQSQNSYHCSKTNTMAKIIDYVVITSSKGVENLESLIKENLRLGWQPLGGVAAVLNPTTETSDPTVPKSIIFGQAMVLYDY